MANDIHVWLSDDHAEALRDLAGREMRSITNMASVLIQQGLEAAGVAIGVDAARPKRGRPIKPREETTP